MLDINKATKRELLRLRGIGKVTADAIIRARPFKSLRDLLRVPGIGGTLLRGLLDQGVVVGKIPTARVPTVPKHPVWSPRLIARIIPGDRPQLMVFEPRTRVVAGFDISDPRIPLVYLSTEDESATFEIENNLPRFEIRTQTGRMEMDIDGVRIESRGRTQTYPWKQKKKIARTLAKLAMKDPVYRSIGVTLGAGLRVAVSATRGVDLSIGGAVIRGQTPRAVVTPQGGISPVSGTVAAGTVVSGTEVSGALVPGALVGEVLPGCTVGELGESVVEGILSVGRRIVECTEETIINIIEDCIDPIPDCLAEAARDKGACSRRCNRRYRKWHNKWRRGPCKAACWVVYGVDAAICLGKALICTVIEIPETVVNCITESGWAPDEPPRDCDIRLYEADDAIGTAIDWATCGYGYSHAALVCGGKIVHARAEGVVSNSLDYYGSRKFAVVRLGLTDDQCKQLCDCVEEKKDADYDYLEAITFGTVDDPGREICTMLIMNCLDEIGFDRESLGLGGFVSPNEIARRLGAPNARNL